MEDDEGPKNVPDSSPSPQRDIGLTVQYKPLHTVEVDDGDAVSNTEQCESVPALGDSQLLVSSSSIEAQNDDAAEHDSPLVVVSASPPEETGTSDAGVSDSGFGDDKEVEVGVEETEIPTDCNSRLDGEAVEAEVEVSTARGERESKCEVEGVDELQLGGVNCPNANEVAAGEIPPVGSGMDWENENLVETKFVGEVESSVGAFVSELDDSQVVGVEGGVSKSELGLDDVKLTNVDVDGVEDGAGEILRGGSEMELGNEVETKGLGGGVGEFVSEFKDSQLLGVEDGVSKCEPGLDESELADVKSPIAGEVVVDGSLQGGNEIELENEVEMKELGGGVGEFVSELDDSQVLGVGLVVATKEDEDKEAVMKGESGLEDTEMEKELEAEVTDEGRSTSVPLLDNSQSVDAEDNEGAEAEDEAPMVDTEMETETEVGETPEADKGASGGGKRKRGKVTKVPAKPPPRKKVIGEDVCFICFDGGDMVLCDRR